MQSRSSSGVYVPELLRLAIFAFLVLPSLYKLVSTTLADTMPPKKKTRFEGTDTTDGGDNKPWKVMMSYHVYYGPGCHSTFYINAADQKGLTKDGSCL